MIGRRVALAIEDAPAGRHFGRGALGLLAEAETASLPSLFEAAWLAVSRLFETGRL